MTVRTSWYVQARILKQLNAEEGACRIRMLVCVINLLLVCADCLGIFYCSRAYILHFWVHLAWRFCFINYHYPSFTGTTTARYIPVSGSGGVTPSSVGTRKTGTIFLDLTETFPKYRGKFSTHIDMPKTTYIDIHRKSKPTKNSILKASGSTGSSDYEPE